MARMHKLEARRAVRVAQVAGVALAVGAAALWALEIPGVNTPASAVPAEAPLPKGAGGEGEPVVRTVMDRARVEDVVWRLEESNPHKGKGEEAKVEPTRPTPASETEWRYLGPIHVGSSMRALVSVNGRQKVLREGAEHEGTRLVSVSEDAITIEDEAKGRREVRRASASGSRVAWLKNVPRPGTVGAVVTEGRTPGAPGAAQGARSATELHARTLERLRSARAGTAVAGAGGVLPGQGEGSTPPLNATDLTLTAEDGAQLAAQAEAMAALPTAADGSFSPDFHEVRAKIMSAIQSGQMSPDDGEAELRRYLEEQGIKHEGPLLPPDGTELPKPGAGT